VKVEQKRNPGLRGGEQLFLAVGRMSALKIACYQILMKSSLFGSHPERVWRGRIAVTPAAEELLTFTMTRRIFFFFFLSFPLRFLLFFAGSALRRAEESPAKKVNAGVLLLSYGQIPGNM